MCCWCRWLTTRITSELCCNLTPSFLCLGAIGAGLSIHFFTFPERYYFDPIVSLLISALILRGAIPLGMFDSLFSRHALHWHLLLLLWVYSEKLYCYFDAKCTAHIEFGELESRTWTGTFSMKSGLCFSFLFRGPHSSSLNDIILLFLIFNIYFTF
jgi:hypothetical protein